MVTTGSKPRKNAWEGFDARILQEKHADKYVRERIRSDRAKSVAHDILGHKENEDVKQSMAIFRAILKDWKELAAKNGARFSVVLLPTGRGRVIKSYIDDDISVIDLYDLFSDRIPDYNYADWDFENDRHWAEAANSLAASLLYRDIATNSALDLILDHVIDRELYTYYSAFDYGWMPNSPDLDYSPPEVVLEAILMRYAPLELSHKVDR